MNADEMIKEGKARQEEVENRIKKIRQLQIDLVKSEPIFERVSRKLSDIVVDNFLFVEQINLYAWRSNYIEKYLYKNIDISLPEMDFLVTQSFDTLLESGSNFDTALAIKLSPWWLITQMRKCAAQFSAPLKIYNWMKELHDPENEICGYVDRRLCDHCEAYMDKVRSLLGLLPESASLVALLIYQHQQSSLSPASLKENCMKQVLALQLPLDCLPLLSGCENMC